MQVRKIYLLAILGLVILVSIIFGGCNSKESVETPDKNLPFTAAAHTQTSVAQTIEAQLTQIAANPQNTQTPVSPASTENPGATSTIADSTVSPPGDSCDQGAFVADVTIPDGTVLKPDEPYVKTWRLKNTGECSWNIGYSVVFDQGDPMGSPANFPLTSGVVLPGTEVEITLNLQAPPEPGEYRGDWKLRNASGQIFGLGNSGTSSFWVIIKVSTPPNFSVFFDNVHPCLDIPHAIFSLFNNGDSAFQSSEITLANLNGTPIFGPIAHNGPFLGGGNECPPGGDTVEPGKKAYLGAGLANAISGQNLRATFKICSQDNLGGSCTTESLDFTIP